MSEALVMSEPEGSGSESGRCAACFFACGICKIVCFACCRRLCPCCCPSPPPPRPEFPVLCVGMGGAGKSTLLAILSGEESSDIQPTMGFAIKVLMTPRAILNVKELGGSEKIRPYWNKYFSGHQAIIFVVDSTCSEDELQETQGELEKCLRDPTLVGIPLLIMCNKQDLAEAKPVEQLREKLQVESLAEGRSCVTQGCSMQDTSGLKKNVELLVDALLLNIS